MNRKVVIVSQLKVEYKKMNLAFLRQGSNEGRTAIFFINQPFQTVGGGLSAFPVVAASEIHPRRNYFYIIN